MPPPVLDWKPDDITLIRAAAAFRDIIAIHPYVHGKEVGPSRPSFEETEAFANWRARTGADLGQALPHRRLDVKLPSLQLLCKNKKQKSSLR